MKKKIIITFLIFFLIFVQISYIIYKDVHNKKELQRNMYITEIYNIIGRYIIWSRLEVGWIWETNSNYESICDIVTRNCLRWTLKWIVSKNQHIYIYVLPINFISEFSGWDFDSRDLDYLTLKWWEKINLIDNSNKIRNFGVFTQDSMNFYSLDELTLLSENQQEILLALKENPRFIFK